MPAKGDDIPTNMNGHPEHRRDDYLWRWVIQDRADVKRVEDSIQLGIEQQDIDTEEVLVFPEAEAFSL